MKAELRLKKEIQIQAVVKNAEYYDNVDQYNHTNKDNINKIRNRMKSRTH